MKKLLAASAIGIAALSIAGGAMAQTKACLITKTETNPFFVKMKEGAQAAAAEHGVELSSFSGKFDTDFEA